MRRKFYTGVCLFILATSVLAAPKKKTTSESWIDAVVNVKMEVLETLQKYSSPIIKVKPKVKAESIRVNLKGLEQLVLITDDGGDGLQDNMAVWANAKLLKADGSYVWLDQVKFNAKKSKFGISIENPYVIFCGVGYDDFVLNNKNKSGDKITIAGTKYDHAIFCPVNSEIVYDLDGKYVGFEAEVGLDESSKNRNGVEFKVLSLQPSTFIVDFKNKYPNEYSLLNSSFEGLDNWLVQNDVELEKGYLEQLIKSLNDKTYYSNALEKIDQFGTIQEKSRNIIELISEVQKVLSLQDKLAWLNITSVNLAYDDMKKQKNFNVVRYAPMLKELTELVNKGFERIYSGDKEAIVNAEKALHLHRSIMLGNTLFDADKILASHYIVGARARKIMSPDLGTQANNWSNQESARRGGFNAEIVELSNLRETINVRSVYKPTNGSSIADLRLHWDGVRAMFTQLQEDKRWNVFEVKLDGTGFRPLVENEERDLEFYDGTYLPDGRILAISNIGYQGVPCVNGKDQVGNLVLYNPNDKNLRRLTFDQDANWNPVIMNNGRVMYTRWEYTDLTHYYTRIVMHMNPDGTENKALYGSGSMFPNSTFDIQPIPGHGSSFVGIISGHHGVARSGRMIVFDPVKGRKNVYGMVQEIPYRNRPIQELIKDRLVDGVWPQFIKPTVLNDKYFLVAAKLSPNSLWGIYLVDVYDNVTCIMETEGEGFISPILVRKTQTPPVIPDKVKLDQKEATFFIQDIYEGEGLRGVPRGIVKELRIHAYEYAYVKTKSDHNWHGIQSGWDIKRLLGTVPVEEDGSVIFKAPANTPISIQPIDKDGVAVQWMRSWVTGQPGEVVSCIGCHEDQNLIAIPKRVIASQKEPSKLTPPNGGVRSFTFDLEIQPILDRNCIACHTGDKAFDLRGGTKDKFGYGTSYLNFHPYIHRQGGEGDMVVLQPYEYHPNTSELVRMLKRGHYNVTLTDKEWRTLYNWIDYNAPDKGYFNANVLTDIPYKGFDQIKRRKELTDKYANGAGVDWKKELADYTSYLKSKGAIIPVMPEPMKEVKVKNVKAKGWPFDAAKAKAKQNEEGEIRKVVEIAPGVKINFVRIPAGEFVMGSYNGPSDTYPTSKVKIKKAFWMAELETTNEQYNVVFPDHDSRFVDQQWKDHVVQGYPANDPQQPVIRVSYDDAMEYCKKLSEKTGLNITLPTEAQWEWACRAGSDDEFWYGDMHVDFGKKDNLADKTTLLFAVAGVDPKPMKSNHSMYKHYTYLPKEESVDDGNLVMIGGKQYEANPFGLYCMHGNVCEWTRSDYVPYPYKENSKGVSEYKVARGGSFFERPKFSTSYSRKGFYPYQRVFNVGFRLIIED